VAVILSLAPADINQTADHCVDLH